MKSAFSLNLIILYIGRLISNVGDWIYMIALTLILAENNGIELTVLWIIRTLVPFFIRFIAGSITDRLGAKFSLVMSDILRGIFIALMPLMLGSWLLFICVFIVSFLSPFFSSSFQPIVASVTNETNRHRVNSILTTIGSSALFIGPLIGGLLFEVNIALAFQIQAISYIVSAITLLFIKVNIPRDESGNLNKSIQSFNVFLKDIAFSFKLIWNNKFLKNVTLSSSAFLLGGAAIDAYEVLFIKNALDLGPKGYAFAVTISGVSFLIGGLLNSIISNLFDRKNLFVYGMTIAVFANILLASSVNLIMLTVSLMLLGIGVTAYTTTAITILQTSIPTQYQGRVMSFQSAIPELASTISVLVAGIFIPLFPIRAVILGAAFITLIAIIPLFSIFNSKQSLESKKNYYSSNN